MIKLPFTNFYTDECKTADDIKELFFKLVDAVINTAQIQGKSIKSASDIFFVMGHFGHINQIKASAYYTDKLTTEELWNAIDTNITLPMTNKGLVELPHKDGLITAHDLALLYNTMIKLGSQYQITDITYHFITLYGAFHEKIIMMILTLMALNNVFADMSRVSKDEPVVVQTDKR